jgi:hypothetical protein
MAVIWFMGNGYGVIVHATAVMTGLRNQKEQEKAVIRFSSANVKGQGDLGHVVELRSRRSGSVRRMWPLIGQELKPRLLRLEWLKMARASDIQQRGQLMPTLFHTTSFLPLLKPCT